MNEKHSEQWELLRYQGRLYQKEKFMLYAIIILLIIALVLSNIVWATRHNNETASAETTEVIQETTAALPTVKTAAPRKKERVLRDTGG